MHPLLRYTLDLFEPQPPPSGAVSNAPASVPLEPAPAVLAGAMPLFRHPLANRQARLGMVQIGYQLKRGKRRTIGFAVGSDGLVVSAPKWTPLYQIDAALAEKSAWILRKLVEIRERHERLEDQRIEWRDGARLLFWASRCNLFSTQAMPLLRLAPSYSPALGHKTPACTWLWRMGPRQPKYGMQYRPG